MIANLDQANPSIGNEPVDGATSLQDGLVKT
jgi:hypothetical protein